MPQWPNAVELDEVRQGLWYRSWGIGADVAGLCFWSFTGRGRKFVLEPRLQAQGLRVHKGSDCYLVILSLDVGKADATAA